MKRIVFFFLFAALMLSLPALLSQFTRGFRVAKLHLDFPRQPEWETGPNPAIGPILQQSFTFIGNGSQCYVFESADGKYVVKLFRFDRASIDVVRLFDACKMAYDRLRDETGIVHIHLNPAPEGLPTLHCKDALGRCHRLCLDNYRFVIQKKGESFQTALLAARQDPLRMQKRLDQFIDLLQARVAQGILNSDPNLSRNFGFLEDRAIELDFGSYRYSPGLDRSAEIRRYSGKLRSWLAKNAPEWVSYLDQRIEALHL